MKKKTVLQEIKTLSLRDIRSGIYANRYKYLLAIPLICIFFFNYCQQVNAYFYGVERTFSPSFMDFCIYLFKGKIFMAADPRMKYEIPIMWLATQMYALYIIGSYTSEDRTRLGQQYILRCTHTVSWYVGKLMYGLVSIALYYLEILMIAILLTVPFSHQVFTMHRDLILMSTNVHIERHNTLDLYRAVFIMPMCTSIVISEVFILMQLIMKPIYGYLVCLLYVLCSDYYMSNALIGNFSMIIRNRQENTIVEIQEIGGVEPMIGLLIEAVIFICTFFIGKVVLQRYDYLEKE